MTPEHERAVADRLHQIPLTAAEHYTHTEIEALLRDWARRNPPGRFALYRIIEDDVGYDGDVFAWGLAHENCVVVRADDETLHGRFVSAASMLSYLSNRHCDIGIVWIDDGSTQDDSCPPARRTFPEM